MSGHTLEVMTDLVLIDVRGLTLEQVGQLRKTMPMSAFIGAHTSGLGRFRDVYKANDVPDVVKALLAAGVRTDPPQDSS